jgi:hypothetical protein
MRDQIPGKDASRKDLGAGKAGSRERKEAQRSEPLVTLEKDSTAFPRKTASEIVESVDSVDEKTWNDTIRSFASIGSLFESGKGDE